MMCIALEMSITFYTGPMAAGKSAALLDLIKEHISAGIPYEVIKPGVDTRCGAIIKSRNGGEHACTLVSTLDEYTPRTLAVFIDEIHFFQDFRILNKWALAGVNIYCAGVFDSVNGGLMPYIDQLLALVDEAIFLQGECIVPECPEPSIRTAFMQAQYVWPQVGDVGDYMPCCRTHFFQHLEYPMGDAACRLCQYRFYEP